MKAFNKRRKPKHAMKIGHNEDYLDGVKYFGMTFSTKRHSRVKSRAYVTYKFDFDKPIHIPR